MKALKEKVEGKIKSMSPKNEAARKKAWKGSESVLKSQKKERAKSYMKKATGEATSKQMKSMLQKDKKKKVAKRKQISNRSK
ncbi:MAG: hypothetical protein Tp1100MES1331091_33 [Prokaryotic dsDNA virus sp.]|nr:MAG: hypothetical protein Tp1100MES1331091_33 [Prokaryotic dsDNA virus sp.]